MILKLCMAVYTKILSGKLLCQWELFPSSGNALCILFPITSPILKTFITGLENQLSLKVKVNRSDNGTEFKNNDLNKFYGMKGIKREFSVPRTPQQNSIAKRKNRTLIETARTMLADSLLPILFWAEKKQGRKMSHNMCFFLSGDLVLQILITLMEMLPLMKMSLSLKKGSLSLKSMFLQAIVLSQRSMMKRPKERLKARDNAAGTLVPAVGQFSTDSTNTFSAVGPSNVAVKLEDITYSDDEDDAGAEADFNNLETSITVSPILTTRVHKDHPVTQIIGDLSSAIQTRKEPKRVHQALKDPSWIEAMQEELLQFKMQKVWVLVDLPHGKRAIGTKWVFRNKKDERGIVVRNKARLVAQGHTQEDGIDYEEVFAPVTRIEAIRLFLAYASFMGFMVYQMDVKSAFLYGTIEKEVYVCQPSGFEDPNYPDKVYKVVKALYGLHLLELDGKSASTPIDIEKPLPKDPDGEDVDVYTYRSRIGSLMYLTSSRPDITFAVCACALFQVTPKASHLHEVKRIFRYLKGKLHLGLWYPKDSPFDLVAYSDSDYAGASLDRKYTTEGCQFLRCRLISWQCKKQTVVATSSTEVDMETLKRMLHVTNILSAGYLTTPQMVLNSPSLTYIKNWLVHIKRSLGWLVQKQTALGKDKSNPLMADNLPTIVWYSTHHVALIKGWLVQKQTALGQTTTGKEISNLFMAGVDTPRCDEDRLELMELTIFLLSSDEKVRVKVSAVDLQTSVAVKKVNDVMRLQALVDKKKVVITEATLRDALRLDDAEGIECLPNKEIFAELARMGYEKPSTKLTFYKEFFSSQWMFLIHTILQCMSAKRTSWNEFSSSMASAVICLSTGSKFNFSKKQVGDLSSHTTKYSSPALTQKVFANIRRVEKGCFGVETPLFEGLIVEQQVDEAADEMNVEDVHAAGIVAEGVVSAADEVPTAVEEPSIPSPTPHTLHHNHHKINLQLPKIETSDDTVIDDVSKQKRMIADIDIDVDVILEDANKEVVVEKSADVLSMQDDKKEPTELQEVVEVVTTAKLITEVVTAASATLTAAVPTLTTSPSAARRIKGVVIRDPKETATSSTIIYFESKSKDKGKGILVEEPEGYVIYTNTQEMG
uniref:Ribonuclease H-like domain-containing protein n=1 Tax=Tanacetum cinerariifolium TaxID=118510 RepID=A0A6L2M5B5_TANCI|nr:ribonuclease H-like domain-containing protein [Tanacetum cinerariifolium]